MKGMKGIRGIRGRIIFLIGTIFIIGVSYQFSYNSSELVKYGFKDEPTLPQCFTITTSWADSINHTLSSSEKFGQLLMVAAYPKKGKNDIERVSRLIRDYKIGGIIFFHGTPSEVCDLAKYYQSISNIPLLIAVDGEWGLSMRIDNTIVYPRQMMLGAIQNDDLIYQMGRDIGRQLKTLGIHINFAPVVDINNNPVNPVINSRSFGEMRDNVVRKSLLYMKGMQDEGIITVAKHFPGHGDTDVDSHYELPVIKHPLERLDSIELYPFRALIDKGVDGVMIAHMNVLTLDSTPNLPSSLSPVIVDTLLKQKLNFKGLVFTDAMSMKGVADLNKPEVNNMLAYEAGNDIILMPDEVEKTIDSFKIAVDSGCIDTIGLEARSLKVLKAKSWVLKHALKQLDSDPIKINAELHKSEFELTRQKLIEESLTIIADSSSIIPIKRIDTCRIASVSLGGATGNEYQRTLRDYAAVDCYHLNGAEDLKSFMKVFDTLKFYDVLLLSIHGNDFRAQKQFGVSDRLMEWTDAFTNRYRVILNAFVNPYLLNSLHYLNNCKAIIVSYENDSVVQNLSAQMLFGAIGAKGHLPVGIGNGYPAGTGVISDGGIRLKYTTPLEAGFDEKKLTRIDSLVYNAIDNKAMPGCQILVARNGKVFWRKSYGYATYQKKEPINNDYLYDLASVTKVTSTIPALMSLDQAGLIDINEPLCAYYKELDSTNKSKIIIKDVLLHQAGFQSWIPFYMSFLEPMIPGQSLTSNKQSSAYPIELGKNMYANKHIKYKDNTFSKVKNDKYTVEVADGLFMNPSLVDSIYNTIYNSKIDDHPTYHYSDLGFYLFTRMIEKVAGIDLMHYTDSCFYKPLGATTLGYLPLHRYDKSVIAPTENDLVFRKQLVQGYVHDPGAAMLGGIAGHAGLFSNSNDLAKYMQMLLNGGTYGGTEFFKKEIVQKYTSSHASEKGNRRGLGFDKPEPNAKSGPTCKGVSTESFGHSGFTGTMVWADPSTGILYIFLSNRVFPDAVNNKLLEMDVRTNIQQVIYDALIK